MYILRNKVQLIGCLGSDPEVKFTPKGKKWARLLLSINESYLNPKGEKVTEKQWHTLIAWGKLADLAEKYLSKGKEIAIEGKLMNRNIIDAQGISRKVTEIIVSDILLLGPRNNTPVAEGCKKAVSRAFTVVNGGIKAVNGTLTLACSGRKAVNDTCMFIYAVRRAVNGIRMFACSGRKAACRKPMFACSEEKAVNGALMFVCSGLTVNSFLLKEEKISAIHIIYFLHTHYSLNIAVR